MFSLRGMVRDATGAGHHSAAATGVGPWCGQADFAQLRFFVLKQWITVPAAPERRCKENLVESRGENHL